MRGRKLTGKRPQGTAPRGLAVNRGNFPAGIEPTQELAAQAFAVSQSAISAWVGRGAPVRPDGTYAILELERWRVALADDRAEVVAVTDLDGEDWATRKLAADAQRRELELERARGELFAREDVERLLQSRLAALVAGLEALPRTLALECAGMEPAAIEARARDLVDELRAGYARDDLVPILEEWRRHAAAGVSVTRGRGRPRGS